MKRIRITEGQYKRLLFNNKNNELLLESDEETCLVKNTTRLYFIKNDLVEKRGFSDITLNPNSEKQTCHIRSTLKRGGKTITWTFYEKPNLVFINIKGDSFSFNLTDKYPQLDSIDEIQLRGYYSLMGDVKTKNLRVETNQLGTTYYIKDNQKIKTTGDDFIAFNDVTIGGILEWFDFVMKDDEGNVVDVVKPEITEEMEEIVSDYSSEIGGYTDQENFDNMMGIIYDNFKDDCKGVRSFVYSYGILKKENIIEETQDVSLFGFDDEYQEYRDLLVMILDKGNRGICDSGDWDRLKKAIS
jgi:hypothetical protein